MFGQMPAAPVDDIFGFKLHLAVPRHHDGFDGFSEQRVGNPGYRRFQNVFPGCDGRLHTMRADADSRTFDETRLPSRDVNESIRIHRSQITGFQTAVCQPCSRSLGISIIPLHDIGAPCHDLSFLAGRNRLTILIPDSQTGMGQSAADGAGFDLYEFRRQIRESGRGLGLPVHDKKGLLRKCIRDFFDEWLGQRPAGLGHETQRRHPEPQKRAAPAQNLIDGRNSGQAGATVFFDEFRRRIRKHEPGIQHKTAAGGHMRVQERRPETIAERQNDLVDIGFRQTLISHNVIGIGADIAMAEHDSPWDAGRSGCEDNGRGIPVRRIRRCIQV